jgi:O-antigen ligase
MKALAFLPDLTPRRFLLPTALLAAVGVGWLTSALGPLLPGLLLGAMFVGFFVVLVFMHPRAGIVAYVVYCFALGAVSRHMNTSAPLGMGMDIVLVLTWLAAVFQHPARLDWSKLKTDFCLLALVWFIINVLEIGNPAGASFAGWLGEMRPITLYWVLTVPLCAVVFSKYRDLRLFLLLIIGLSVLGALYGIKQKVLGVDVMEQQWLDSGQAQTHLLWGKLRVFSFYAEAAQFGASQAHIGLVCLILALGPFVWWKRILFAVASAITLYGMLISGTRGAMFVLAVGTFIYLVLSKQAKVLVLGLVLASGAFFVLKYTYIGNSNTDIARLRSSLDPQDASFQLRLQNQATLRDYLASRPFGEGVGSIGNWGHRYNADKFISTIEPDSYYVKIWAEYGIVGFVIWFGMMMFMLGKCCGIVWNIRNPQLRQQLLALTAGFGGILISSYGNEVMNQIPSSMILYLSWVFIFLGPELDTSPSTHDLPSYNASLSHA